MKLLVGFDGSNSSQDALDLACTYAKALEAEIVVVTSMEEGDDDDVKEINRSEEQLESAREAIARIGIPVTTHLLIRGMKPGEDVVNFAKEKIIDAIFIGIKRRSKVGKLLFGSNAQYIILNAPCPVMTVK